MSLMDELGELLSEPKHVIHNFYNKLAWDKTITINDLTNLLYSGLDMDINQIYIFACGTGDLDKVKFLLSQGADINHDHSMGLRYAIAEQNKNIIDFLLENGIDFFNEGVMWDAIESHNIPMVKLLLDNGFIVKNELVLPIIQNIATTVYNNNDDLTSDITIIKLFIEQGIDPNIFTKYYLEYIFPAKASHNKFLSLMQNTGANFNTVISELLETKTT